MQSHSHSHYAAVPLPSHPHPPPPPHHPPSYSHHPPPYPFAPHPNGASQQYPQPQAMAETMPGPDGMMRFGIPLEPSPMMAGARHKKDIKRRTKTGCLTCRKRRIKCDEGHPACRNCQKSKRECLGYDPIFKQQSSGHAAIQPAPAHSSPGTPSTRETASPVPGAYYSHPSAFGGYSQPIHQQPASLDPALASSGQNMAANGPIPSLHPYRNPKPITIDDLFSLNDVPPTYPLWDKRPQLPQKELDDLYRLHFAPSLDRLFETIWYSTRGPDVLRQTPSVNDFADQCSHHFRTSDPAATPAMQSLEARLVWQLAALPRSAALESTTDALLTNVLARVDTVECLLTGQYLSPDMVPPPPSSSQHTHTEYNERQFWHQLATFTSVHDDGTDPRAQSTIDAALNAMRAILGMMENRDVLYSLAIARHFGGRVAEFHPRQPLNRPNDINSDVYKLEVARHFVDLEDQKGMTQVIQRICGMAMRSWILQKR